MDVTMSPRRYVRGSGGTTNITKGFTSEVAQPPSDVGMDSSSKLESDGFQPIELVCEGEEPLNESDHWSTPLTTPTKLKTIGRDNDCRLEKESGWIYYIIQYLGIFGASPKSDTCAVSGDDEILKTPTKLACDESGLPYSSPTPPKRKRIRRVVSRLQGSEDVVDGGTSPQLKVSTAAKDQLSSDDEAGADDVSVLRPKGLVCDESGDEQLLRTPKKSPSDELRPIKPPRISRRFGMRKAFNRPRRSDTDLNSPILKRRLFRPKRLVFDKNHLSSKQKGTGGKKSRDVIDVGASPQLEVSTARVDQISSVDDVESDDISVVQAKRLVVDESDGEQILRRTPKRTSSGECCSIKPPKTSSKRSQIRKDVIRQKRILNGQVSRSRSALLLPKGAFKRNRIGGGFTSQLTLSGGSVVRSNLQPKKLVFDDEQSLCPRNKLTFDKNGLPTTLTVASISPSKYCLNSGVYVNPVTSKKLTYESGPIIPLETRPKRNRNGLSINVDNTRSSPTSEGSTAAKCNQNEEENESLIVEVVPSKMPLLDEKDKWKTSSITSKSSPEQNRLMNAPIRFKLEKKDGCRQLPGYINKAKRKLNFHGDPPTSTPRYPSNDGNKFVYEDTSMKLMPLVDDSMMAAFIDEGDYSVFEELAIMYTSTFHTSISRITDQDEGVEKDTSYKVIVHGESTFDVLDPSPRERGSVCEKNKDDPDSSGYFSRVSLDASEEFFTEKVSGKENVLENSMEISESTA